MARERVVGFQDLLVQMRVTNALLVLTLQRSHDITQSQLALAMAATGAPASEIATILGTTVNTVQVTLSRGRRRHSRQPKAGTNE